MHTNPEVLALLALGEEVATPAERSHVSTCPACSEEVAELGRIADVGRRSPSAEALAAPSPEVWRRISVELGFDAPSAVLSERRPQQQREDGEAAAGTVTELSRRRDAGAAGRNRTSAARRFVALAVAAALALVVGIGIGVGYERHVVAPTSNRVIASADLSPLPQFPGASGTAQVTADGRGGRTLIIRMNSPRPLNGTIQVWLMDSEGRATWMGPMKNGVAELPITPGMSLFERPTVDVSDDPGNHQHPTTHTGTSILRGVLV